MSDQNLLRVVKYRVMDELRDAVQKHQVYADKTRVYHKFPFTERPSIGVLLKNASANRIKLSADDCAGTLKSHLALAKAENKPSGCLDWVWEDSFHLTLRQENEDLSSQIVGTSSYGQNRVFYTDRKPIVCGYNNTNIADNFRQVDVLLNGAQIFPEYVNGKKGMVILPKAPVAGDTLTISYYYGNLTPPGRYYIEITAPQQFMIYPLYQVRDEEVITRTTGTEITASLENGGLYGDFDVLYTMKTRFSNKIYLQKATTPAPNIDDDYTVTTAGVITFLKPLPVDTTLFANYRWAPVTNLGPFSIPESFHYVNDALPGVVLCFSNQLNVGTRMVVIVYPDREPSAKIFSGHYRMSFDIEVFAKDPIQLPDLTDHIINEIWSNRRLVLMNEGLTIEEMDPTGESEEVYDNNTGDLYYKNGISLQIMTEWKKYEPFKTEIMDFDTKLYQYMNLKEYIVTNQNQLLELRLQPWTVPFEVKYPESGYTRVM
jgi:hypothetical protein